VPPELRFVPRFAAEPPQEALPYGRWADTLTEYFLAAVAEIDAGEEDLGTPGEVRWFPDRSWNGSTYIPATAPTSNGYELFGYVRFELGERGGPTNFLAYADFTEETAAEHPEWSLDLNEEVVGTWRGEEGKTADMTLVWGTPIEKGGATVTAELADLTVDQCHVTENRFTLIAPDAYRGDYLEVKLFAADGRELATESLYVDDEEDEE
jgi:hypothetical protein